MLQAAPAPRFSATPLDPIRPLVNAGDDTKVILASLGYDEDAIVKLIADKVAGAPKARN